MYRKIFVFVIFFIQVFASSQTSCQQPPQKRLRIFFSWIHPRVTESMASALNHLGHILVLPGESFAPDRSDRPLLTNQMFQEINMAILTIIRRR